MISIGRQYRTALLVGGALVFTVMLVVTGCKSLDVENLNGIGTDDLVNKPTPTAIYAAAQGLLSAWRGTTAGDAGTLSKYGYEHWQMRFSEPRTLTNVFVFPQTGGFWGYGTVENIDVLLKAVEAVGTGLTDQQKEGIRGWAKLNLAVQYEDMAQAHDTFGIVLELPANARTDIPPIETKPVVWTRIFALLDQADQHLANAGTSFGFKIHSGWAGFNTPTNMRKVVQALKARYQVLYAAPGVAGTANWNAALTALGLSFLDASPAGTANTTAGLKRGPFHVYTTGAGDATNGLNAADRYSNMRIVSEAQKQANGTTLDARALQTGASAKTITVASFTFAGVTSTLRHRDYLNPAAGAISATSPLPIIRNEELILLRAEANYNLGNLSLAIADINLIRVNSGNLPPISDPYVPVAPLGQPAALLDELLYEKRYSLWGEMGTVWLDMHHYGKMLEIPAYDPTFKIFDIFPIQDAECVIRGYQPITKGCFLGGYAGLVPVKL